MNDEQQMTKRIDFQVGYWMLQQEELKKAQQDMENKPVSMIYGSVSGDVKSGKSYERNYRHHPSK